MDQVLDDAARAGGAIGPIPSLVKRAPPRKDSTDINNAVLDVMTLTRSELVKYGASLQTDLATSLPLVEGDRVQLQQVMLNLIMNAADAMSSLAEDVREPRISTSSDTSSRVLASVRDTGPGLQPTIVDRLFEPFCTTKPEGMGMGLAICRSTIEAHGGRL